MTLPALDQLEAAAALVHQVFPPTPQIRWPLVCLRAGADVWIKHENHTPVGAFKVRGGIPYMHDLRRTQPSVTGVIAATRGNHGQSIAFAAARAGLRAVIVVPYGNSQSKNHAMRALGAELVEHGADFQEAYEHASALSQSQGLHFVRSFHPALVAGVASLALELFRAVPHLDTVYTPIGLGSGICGLIAARQALGLATEIVGVVARGAPAYALSYAARRPIAAPADTMADGMAVRVPDPEALDIILDGAARIVTVDDAEIRAAIGHLFSDTHNVAEGAGAAPLAALLQERPRIQGRRAALILTGGNIDRELYAGVLTSAASIMEK